MMIKFVDICWAHESSTRQQSLQLFHNPEYRMMPGEYGLLVDETKKYIHFLSGNKVLCLSKTDAGEKYEYVS